MDKLKTTWQDLINLVSTSITLRKFAENSYDEDWDQGTAQYTVYTIDARIKYDLTERDLELLGEEMLLDAIVYIRDIDLSAQSLTIATQDQFQIDSKNYRITKIRPRIIASEQVGYEIGIKEILP